MLTITATRAITPPRSMFFLPRDTTTPIFNSNDHARMLLDELVLKIFAFLPAEDLLLAASASKDWRTIALDHQLWSILLRRSITNEERSDAAALVKHISGNTQTDNALYFLAVKLILRYDMHNYSFAEICKSSSSLWFSPYQELVENALARDRTFRIGLANRVIKKDGLDGIENGWEAEGLIYYFRATYSSLSQPECQRLINYFRGRPEVRVILNIHPAKLTENEQALIVNDAKPLPNLRLSFTQPSPLKPHHDSAITEHQLYDLLYNLKHAILTKRDWVSPDTRIRIVNAVGSNNESEFVKIPGIFAKILARIANIEMNITYFSLQSTVIQCSLLLQIALTELTFFPFSLLNSTSPNTLFCCMVANQYLSVEDKHKPLVLPLASSHLNKIFSLCRSNSIYKEQITSLLIQIIKLGFPADTEQTLEILCNWEDQHPEAMIQVKNLQKTLETYKGYLCSTEEYEVKGPSPDNGQRY